MSLRTAVPWWGRIGAKIVLSRMPAGYRFWRRLNVFVHGDMANPEYALSVVRWHLEHIGRRDFTGLTVLELGPGDSIGTAVIAKALGARRTILVDAGPYATPDPQRYRALADFLRARGLEPPDLSGCADLAAVLRRCDGEYLSDGVASLSALPAESVDVAFSHAVLEHVRRGEARSTFEQLARVTRRDGVGSHKVDLRDHLGGALNNLRFRERVWEARWMASSGFYTNRLQRDAMCALMREAGFDVTVTATERFSALPTPRTRLAEPFRSMSDEDLLISGFDVLLRRRTL
jgi:hypothetical protein